MSYEKQNFEDNQVLEASDLNHIEDGIVDNERAIEKKQDKLVSGSNIKTINNQSLIGSGNISINPDLSGYATKEFVQTEIEQAQLENKEIDLSGYATKTELNNKADKTELNSYATKSELNNKANKTELNIYATKSELNNKANRTELNSYATKEFVQTEIEQAQLEDKEIDLSNYQLKNDNSLQTSNKTIVGAINEIDTKSLTAIDYTDGTDIVIEDVSNVDLSNYQQKTDNNLQTYSKNLVGAINELFQNANNGKELIASAIGEPLSSEDTFSAMSSDINSLLSTFKSNMMNAGVVVESGDKFESLIEKIKGLTEGEGNKGVQIVSGEAVQQEFPTNTDNHGLKIALPFVPIVVVVDYYVEIRYKETTIYPGELLYPVQSYAIYNSFVLNDNCLTYMSYPDGGGGDPRADYYNVAFDDDKKTICFETEHITNSGLYDYNFISTTYWAIGVGEEDTTLRDSLANILENKGVDVTEEDDMADLITKVDSIQTGGGLDIIAATELPATGNNMQLCAITNNITDSFILSNDEADVIISNDNTIGLHLSDLTMYEKYSYPIGGLSINLRIASAHQNASAIPLWLYYNNAWKQICFNSLFIIRDMLLQNGFTISNAGSLGNYNSSKGISILPGNRHKLIGYTPFKEPVDFSKYRAIRIKGTYKNTYESSGTFGPGIGIFGRASNISNGIETGVGFGLTDIESVFEGEFARSTDFTTNVTTSTPFDITFNVSGINTQYYLGIATAFTEYTYITDIELIMN